MEPKLGQSPTYFSTGAKAEACHLFSGDGELGNHALEPAIDPITAMANFVPIFNRIDFFPLDVRAIDFISPGSRSRQFAHERPSRQVPSSRCSPTSLVERQNHTSPAHEVKLNRRAERIAEGPLSLAISDPRERHTER